MKKWLLKMGNHIKVPWLAIGSLDIWNLADLNMWGCEDFLALISLFFFSFFLLSLGMSNLLMGNLSFRMINDCKVMLLVVNRLLMLMRFITIQGRMLYVWDGADCSLVNYLKELVSCFGCSMYFYGRKRKLYCKFLVEILVYNLVSMYVYMLNAY